MNCLNKFFTVHDEKTAVRAYFVQRMIFCFIFVGNKYKEKCQTIKMNCYAYLL